MKFSTGLIMGIFFGIVVAILSIVILFLGFTKEDGNYILEVARVLFSGGIFLTVIVAIIQIRQNGKKALRDEEWNKKYLAYQKINEYIKDLEVQRTLLDKITVENNLIQNSNKRTISFSDRRNFKEPLSYKEVHNWVCEKDDNNNHIIADIDSNKCATSQNGTIVIRSLISIINTYEMIASGIFQNILSREIMLEMMGTSIIKNYEFMKDYIEHRRTNHEHPTFATEWEKLYSDIKKGKT